MVCGKNSSCTLQQGKLDRVNQLNLGFTSILLSSWVLNRRSSSRNLSVTDTCEQLLKKALTLFKVFRASATVSHDAIHNTAGNMTSIFHSLSLDQCFIRAGGTMSTSADSCYTQGLSKYNPQVWIIIHSRHPINEEEYSGLKKYLDTLTVLNV